MKSAYIVKDSEKSWGKIPLSSIIEMLHNKSIYYLFRYVVEDPIA